MRKSTMGGIIALLLAGLLTITAGIGSAVNGKWFKNSDIKTWFNGWVRVMRLYNPKFPITAVM